MMMRNTWAALGLLLLLGTQVQAQQPITLPVGGPTDLTSPVVRAVKAELGIDYRTEGRFGFQVKVVRSSEAFLRYTVDGHENVTKSNLEWRLSQRSRYGRSEVPVVVTVSSAKLAAMHPHGLPKLDGVLSGIRRDGERKVQQLVDQLPAFRKAATPNFISADGLLRINSGMYPELVNPLEQHVREKLGKTRGEFLALETEVVMGKSRKLQITPVEGKAGYYRVVIGQPMLARIAKRNLRMDNSWLTRQFKSRWLGGGDAPKEAETRFQEFVEWNRASLARQAEAKAAFAELMETWAKKAATPAEASRVRSIEIVFDAFEEIGVRSKPLEVFKRGHVEMDFGEEVRRFKATTLNVEDYFLEKIAEQGKTATVRKSLMATAFAKALAEHKPVVVGRSTVPQVERAPTLESLKVEAAKAFERARVDAARGSNAATVRGVGLVFDAFTSQGALWSKAIDNVRHEGRVSVNVETWWLETLITDQVPKAKRATLLQKGFATAFGAKPWLPEAKLPRTWTEPELDRFRRADKTVDWKTAVKNGAFRQVGGVAHFAMALFLKELAVTVQTGDPQRLDEFFEFLTTTDFFVHYGLFAAGAQVGSVAYNKFLAKHIKPRFVSGILRTNLVLATGMALPELVHGRFDGKAFAIDLTSLGLASTAVKTAVEGIRWVTNLKKAEQAGRLARAGTGIRRLARAGGWFYTVAETAVVLYIGDAIAQRWRSHIAEEEARDALGAATERFLKRSLDPEATPRQLEEALRDFATAQADYRNFLFRKLDLHGQTYASRMAKAATRAKLLADERATLAKKLERLPAMKQRLVDRHGSIEKYLDHTQREKSADLDALLAESTKTFEAARKAELEAVFGKNRRKGAFELDLSDAERIRWLVSEGKAGEAGDPFDGRTDLMARRGRDAERRALRESAGAVSENRLQAFADERNVLAQVRKHLSGDLRKVLDTHVKALQSLEARERELFGQVSPGLADALKRAR